MAIYYPISGLTILIIAIILGSPIIALGLKISEVFEFISLHVLEITLGCFALCFVVALIYWIITKNLKLFFPLFLNTPAIGIIIAFSIAEITKTYTTGGLLGGFVFGTVAFIFTLIGWLATLVISVGIIYFVSCDEELSARASFGISLIGAVLQFIIFAICFI